MTQSHDPTNQSWLDNVLADGSLNTCNLCNTKIVSICSQFLQGNAAQNTTSRNIFSDINMREAQEPETTDCFPEGAPQSRATA